MIMTGMNGGGRFLQPAASNGSDHGLRQADDDRWSWMQDLGGYGNDRLDDGLCDTGGLLPGTPDEVTEEDRALWTEWESAVRYMEQQEYEWKKADEQWRLEQRRHQQQCRRKEQPAQQQQHAEQQRRQQQDEELQQHLRVMKLATRSPPRVEQRSASNSLPIAMATELAVKEAELRAYAEEFVAYEAWRKEAVLRAGEWTAAAEFQARMAYIKSVLAFVKNGEASGG